MAAKHALHRTGNNSAEMAISWYFENMDDASLNQPLPLVAAAGGEPEEAKAGGVSEESVQQLMGMGFPEKKCKKALRECDNNLERAMEWIFSHMDDDGEDEEMPAADEGGAANVADMEA